MEFKSKYSIGTVVFYPSADASDLQIIKAPITAVVFAVDGKGKSVISYKTEASYGIPEEVMSETYKDARKRLEKLLKDKMKDVQKDFEKAYERFKKFTEEELVYVADSLREDTPDEDAK